MISIKDAYIDSSSEKKDSGKIDITAVRNVMGVSRIDVDDATITAEGKSGHKAGMSPSMRRRRRSSMPGTSATVRMRW